MGPSFEKQARTRRNEKHRCTNGFLTVNQGANGAGHVFLRSNVATATTFATGVFFLVSIHDVHEERSNLELLKCKLGFQKIRPWAQEILLVSLLVFFLCI